MSCFEGRMKEYERVSLDKFDGKNLQSTVYFLSHLHSDHTRGLKDEALFKRFKTNKGIYLFCSEVTEILLLADDDFRRLAPYIKSLPLNTPTSIDIVDPLFDEPDKVTVTFLPAFHCPGSIMVLIEGEEGNVLYTGDFRWEHFDIEHMHHLRSGEAVKKIKSLYIDTTFLTPNTLHIPSRLQCMEAVSQLIKEWTEKGQDYVAYIYLRAQYGHEPLLTHVSTKLKKKVHVNKQKFAVYDTIQQFSGNFTPEGTGTQIHACGKMCTVTVDGERIACKDQHDPSRVLVVLPTTMYFTQFRHLTLDKIIKCVGENFYRACYSFHSSYTEVKDLISYLKPDRVFANVQAQNDSSLNVTQHRLNQMLKECKQAAMEEGETNEEEVEVKELGTLKTRAGRSKKRKAESISDSDSLDFGSPAKLAKGDSTHSTRQTRASKSQMVQSQPMEGGRRSTRRSVAGSETSSTQVTPKKGRRSTRSSTPDLFNTPIKHETSDISEAHSSYLGSQQSDVSEMDLLLSSQKSSANLEGEDLYSWSNGGSFLAAITSSSEDDTGRVCVDDDIEQTDETIQDDMTSAEQDEAILEPTSSQGQSEDVEANASTPKKKGQKKGKTKAKATPKPTTRGRTKQKIEEDTKNDDNEPSELNENGKDDAGITESASSDNKETIKVTKSESNKDIDETDSSEKAEESNDIEMLDESSEIPLETEEETGDASDSGTRNTKDIELRNTKDEKQRKGVKEKDRHMSEVLDEFVGSSVKNDKAVGKVEKPSAESLDLLEDSSQNNTDKQYNEKQDSQSSDLILVCSGSTIESSTEIDASGTIDSEKIKETTEKNGMNRNGKTNEKGTVVENKVEDEKDKVGREKESENIIYSESEGSELDEEELMNMTVVDEVVILSDSESEDVESEKEILIATKVTDSSLDVSDTDGISMEVVNEKTNLQNPELDIKVLDTDSSDFTSSRLELTKEKSDISEVCDISVKVDNDGVILTEEKSSTSKGLEKSCESGTSDVIKNSVAILDEDNNVPSDEPITIADESLEAGVSDVEQTMESQKETKPAFDDDVYEVVDLTGDDFTVDEYEPKNKKKIKISFSKSKDQIMMEKRNREELKRKREEENEIEEISSSPEWLSTEKRKGVGPQNSNQGKSSEVTAFLQAMDKDDDELEEKKVEDVVDKEERAELKRQAMGFVCETDSESDIESSDPDSPTGMVLYDDFVELSSGDDDDDKDGKSGSSKSRKNRKSSSSQKGNKSGASGDANFTNTGTNRPSDKEHRVGDETKETSMEEEQVENLEEHKEPTDLIPGIMETNFAPDEPLPPGLEEVELPEHLPDMVDAPVALDEPEDEINDETKDKTDSPDDLGKFEGETNDTAKKGTDDRNRKVDELENGAIEITDDNTADRETKEGESEDGIYETTKDRTADKNAKADSEVQRDPEQEKLHQMFFTFKPTDPKLKFTKPKRNFRKKDSEVFSDDDMEIVDDVEEEIGTTNESEYGRPSENWEGQYGDERAMDYRQQYDNYDEQYYQQHHNEDYYRTDRLDSQYNYNEQQYSSHGHHHSKDRNRSQRKRSSDYSYDRTSSKGAIDYPFAQEDDLVSDDRYKDEDFTRISRRQNQKQDKKGKGRNREQKQGSSKRHYRGEGGQRDAYHMDTEQEQGYYHRNQVFQQWEKLSQQSQPKLTQAANTQAGIYGAQSSYHQTKPLFPIQDPTQKPLVGTAPPEFVPLKQPETVDITKLKDTIMKVTGLTVSLESSLNVQNPTTPPVQQYLNSGTSTTSLINGPLATSMVAPVINSVQEETSESLPELLKQLEEVKRQRKLIEEIEEAKKSESQYPAESEWNRQLQQDWEKREDEYSRRAGRYSESDPYQLDPLRRRPSNDPHRRRPSDDPHRPPHHHDPHRPQPHHDPHRPPPHRDPHRPPAHDLYPDDPYYDYPPSERNHHHPDPWHRDDPYYREHDERSEYYDRIPRHRPAPPEDPYYEDYGEVDVHDPHYPSRHPHSHPHKPHPRLTDPYYDPNDPQHEPNYDPHDPYHQEHYREQSSFQGKQFQLSRQHRTEANQRGAKGARGSSTKRGAATSRGAGPNTRGTGAQRGARGTGPNSRGTGAQREARGMGPNPRGAGAQGGAQRRGQNPRGACAQRGTQETGQNRRGAGAQRGASTFSGAGQNRGRGQTQRGKNSGRGQNHTSNFLKEASERANPYRKTMKATLLSRSKKVLVRTDL